MHTYTPTKPLAVGFKIVLPRSMVRLSAGRMSFSQGEQALLFMAGANSIFYGDKLLVTGNPDTQADVDLLERLGMERAAPHAH